ncbi:MAG: hypothetical protein A2X77_00290 [Gammaproteobacteria bacterium GWE2_42_36]|nr:MAG: hypothetical protein A2X77_00290 [Gammaproteobacteria bacterium GWE2_42_36]HCU05254.1 hypothetical protein [Coxiellaceae bacterium]
MKMTCFRGFSLIELLCAMSMGLGILATLSAVFLFYQRVNEETKTRVMVNDHLRYAGFYLKDSIASAGFIGCHRFTAHFPLINNGVMKEDQLHWDQMLKVYTGAQNPWLLPTHEDVIEVHALSTLTAHLLQATDPTHPVVVSLDQPFEVGDDVLIADCHHAETLQVQSVKIIPGVQQTLTFTQPFQGDFSANAVIGLLVTKIFFIQNTSRKDITGALIPALYEMNAAGEKSEVVAGIKTLQVTAYLRHFEAVLANQVVDGTSIPVLRIDLMAFSRSESLVNLSPIEKPLSIFIAIGDGYVTP